jgi:hypothetical protein
MFLIALLPLLPKFPLGANKVIFYAILFKSRVRERKNRPGVGEGTEWWCGGQTVRLRIKCIFEDVMAQYPDRKTTLQFLREKPL